MQSTVLAVFASLMEDLMAADGVGVGSTAAVAWPRAQEETATSHAHTEAPVRLEGRQGSPIRVREEEPWVKTPKYLSPPDSVVAAREGG